MISRQDKHAEFQHNLGVFDRAEVFWGWDTPAGERRGLRRVKNFLDFLGPCKGKHFLELGCGKGWFTQKMKDCGARITALDIQKEFVEVARQRVSGNNVRFLVGDGEFLPFACDTFDGLYGAAVLHHLPMDTTFREIIRVLKPGGKIAYAEPNMLNPQLMIMKNIWWIGKRMGESPNETAFFKWEMRAFLRRMGFVHIEVEPFDFLHPLTPQSMIHRVERWGKALEKCPLVREVAGSLDIRAIKGVMA